MQSAGDGTVSVHCICFKSWNVRVAVNICKFPICQGGISELQIAAFLYVEYSANFYLKMFEALNTLTNYVYLWHGSISTVTVCTFYSIRVPVNY